MNTTTPRAVPHRRATTLLTLVLPLAIISGAVAIVLSWRDELPDQVATHWSDDGVDAVGSIASMIIPFTLICTVFVVGMWALARFSGHAAMTRRFATGIAVWLAVFLGGLLIVTFDAQRGLEDAYSATGLGTGVLVTVGASFASGIAAGCVVPGDPARPAATTLPPTTATLPLEADERAVWVQTVGQSTATMLALVASVAAGSIALGLATEWWIGLVLAVGLLPLLALLHATVIVDRRGLTARTMIPWPKITVPLDEIEDVSVTRVRPLGEFGGWGIRTSLNGSVGMVLRKGEGIEVRATGGRRIVVTVDDAATGAALLATLASRAR